MLISIFAFGVGILAGIFNVFCRDVGHTFSIILQIWSWFTPVVYPIEAVPANLRWILDVNPLTPLVRTYQDALLWHSAPDALALSRPLILGLCIALAAWLLFRRAASELVDEL